MLHGIGRAGLQAATAGRSDAQLLGDALVGLEDRRGQHPRQVDAWAELRGEEVRLQTEGAHAGLDGEVAVGEVAVAAVLQ